MKVEYTNSDEQYKERIENASTKDGSNNKQPS